MPDSHEDTTPTFLHVISATGEVIDKYAALRGGIFRELVAMKSLVGGPWRIQYTRNPSEGDPAIPVKWTHHTTTGPIEIGGQRFNGIAQIRAPETYAPIKQFDLLDPNGGKPEPQSDTALAESRLFYLLSAALQEVKALAGVLPLIQQEARAKHFKTDLTGLGRLSLQLPVFPYWPRSPKEMVQADFDRVLADEKPVLDQAKLALHCLSMEESSLLDVNEAPPAIQRRPDGQRAAVENPGVEDLVNLDEAAAIVHRSKRTLERQLSKMPAPYVQGGGGKPSLWKWAELRPWLEREFVPDLPTRFPRNVR